MDGLNFLISCLEQIGVALSDTQVAELLQYRSLVLEANSKFNLTAIADGEEFTVKHIIDSLLGVSEIPAGAKLCDIGAGGGFPSIPLAIAREDIKVFPLDSTAKKMSFVQEAARELGLSNVKTVAGRAEEQRSLFGTFDAVTARAVSSLPILLELAMPLLRVGGVFIAYKTDDSELAISKNALATLNAKLINKKSAALPNGDSRCILVFEKLKDTNPKYPRQYGAIKKKPL